MRRLFLTAGMLLAACLAGCGSSAPSAPTIGPAPIIVQQAAPAETPTPGGNAPTYNRTYATASSPAPTSYGPTPSGGGGVGSFPSEANLPQPQVEAIRAEDAAVEAAERNN